ncbi:histidine kinase [Sediminicola sp. YIK13]|uniref:histidine kinase dimerization/phosphoacceptor domain -containing protein n=1 Tax=Sediminicola sp. YIK13 TaxID=1453352 RepID=UPI0007214AE9|nr:histidine kinase dimerization/phosphoacceptor domain -containing protein [Sediminicola sp. YIK13]ALM08817.1 histidine kinase [Sediminicola sp. YIK13]
MYNTIHWHALKLGLHKKILWFFLLSFGFGFFVNAQSQRKVDSLISILETKTITQKEKARLLSKIAYHHPIPMQSLDYANASLAIAKELNDDELKAEAWEELSHVERLLGNNPKSFEASYNALRIYEELKMIERQAASYVQIGSNYVNDKDYPSAILNLSKASDIYKKSNTSNYAITLVNLGEAYRLSGDLDLSIDTFNEVIKLNDALNDDLILAYTSGNLGMAYAAQGKTLEAKQKLETAIEILVILGDPYSLSIFLAEMGNIYTKERQLIKAEMKFLEALDLARHNGLKEQIRDFSALLSTFYENQQLYKKALIYKKDFQKYQDSLVNKANIQKIEQLKAGYEINKRETEINLLNTINANQRNKMLILGVGIFIFSLLAYMLYKSNKAIKKVSKRVSAQNVIIEKREQEKALLLKELNHRVKNNLQMISSLLNLQSRELSGHPAQEALLTGKNRVEALSLVHQKLYQEGIETKVFLKDYIEELVLGLFYGYNISFEPELDIDDSSISIDKAIPIALIVNEMVVNSLKYAYNGTPSPKFRLVLKKVNDTLEINISDNGIGFTEKEGAKQNSFGLKLIKSLISQLDGSMERVKTKGTHWQIMIKNI